jgi:hypothetical protein
MAKTGRIVVVGMAIAIGMVGVPGAHAADRGIATADIPAAMRVRAQTPALFAVIQEARERSTTFRGLLETINASDGIVYRGGPQSNPSSGR